MADVDSLEEDENVVEYFGPTKIQYTWEPSSEPLPRKKGEKPSPPTRIKHITSYSTSNSPATKARLNSSSNNPFLLEDNDATYNDVNTSEFAHLFEKRTSEDVQNEEETTEGSLIDVSNFSNDSDQEQQNWQKQQAEERKSEQSNDVQNSDALQGQTQEISAKTKPKRPPRVSSKNIQASPNLTSKRTQTTPRRNKDHLQQQDNPQLIGSSYATKNHEPRNYATKHREPRDYATKPRGPRVYATKPHGPRVYGKNYKYMKGYIKTVVQQPSEADFVILESTSSPSLFSRRKKDTKLQTRHEVANLKKDKKTTSSTKHLRTSSQDRHLYVKQDGVRKPSNIQIDQVTPESSEEEVISAKFAQDTNRSIPQQGLSLGGNESSENENQHCKLRNNRTELQPYSEEESHRQILKLQQELKSTGRKIQKLKEINVMALNRKDVLQREVLDAYKKISNLEIASKSHATSNRELCLEITLVKQRIGEAEREAAKAIGRTSKLERDLKDADTRRQRYYDELNTAESHVATLETELKETKEKMREEIAEKNQVSQQFESKVKELERQEVRYQDLEAECQHTEDNNTAITEKLDITMKERSKCEAQVEELSKANISLKDDLHRLQTKYEISQRTVEQCTNRIKTQKDKFDSMISSRLNLEKELREMQCESSRQRSENQQCSDKCKELMGRLTESKTSLNKAKDECDNLQKENRNLKDKVLYLDLYKQMMDDKTKQGHIILSEDKKNTPRMNEKHTPRMNEKQTYESDFNHISKKLEHLKNQHNSLHKEAFKSHVSSHSNYQSKQSPKRNEQNGALQQKHYTHSMSETSENNPGSPGMIYSDTFFQNGSKQENTRFQIVDENQTISHQDDTLELKTDDSCYSPIELEVDLEDRPVIYPSFAASLQNNDLQNNNESNFSDLLHTGNNDIANALL